MSPYARLTPYFSAAACAVSACAVHTAAICVSFRFVRAGTCARGPHLPFAPMNPMRRGVVMIVLSVSAAVGRPGVRHLIVLEVLDVYFHHKKERGGGMSAGRSLLSAAVVAAAAACFSQSAPGAQPYPERPVRVIVAFAAGGVADGVTRRVTQHMSEGLKQSFVVDNRGGAGGNIAAQLAAEATPDGHTLLTHTAASAVNVTLYRNLRFDLLRDLTPVANTVSAPGVFSVLASHP